MLLRPYQSRLVERAEKALKTHGNTLAIAATGAGKTVCISELARRIGGKQLVIQHRQELVTQNRGKFLRMNPKARTGLYTADAKTWKGDTTFAMVQTLVNSLGSMPKMDVLIIDECFVAGTMVDGRPIESLCVGDKVISWSHDYESIEEKEIINVFKSKPSIICAVTLDDGRSLVCTVGHPFYVKGVGYVEAMRLEKGSEVLSAADVHMVRGEYRKSIEKKKRPIQGVRASLLPERMREGVSFAHIIKNDGGDEQKVRIGAHDQEQPNGQGINCQENEGNTQAYRTRAESHGRKRDGINAPTRDFDVRYFHAEPDAGISDQDGHGEIVWLPSCLQGGSRDSECNGCRRDRRGISSRQSEAVARQKKRTTSGVVRVESVEIHQPTSDGTFGGMCPDGFVYNIEVSGNNNYFANGVLVHNCHHACAPSWKSIIDTVRGANPNALVAGFTATPERTDKKALRGIFSNVCDTVTIRELVQLGFLVPPRGFVIDVQGTQGQLQGLDSQSDWFDQAEVARVLNTVAVNDEVVRNWKERAADRRTVVFCATVQHAQDVAEAFQTAGVTAACVHGEMPAHQRKDILTRFDRGQIQVVTNVMVLTEGFDSQPVACVILLRKCSAKPPLIQMVGRGLRTVNPEEYPGVVKRDCIILDFGTSLLTHGDLEAGNALGDDGEHKPGEAETKTCPGCDAELPIQTRTCPFCGHEFGEGSTEEVSVTRVSLTEMDILNASPFRYIDLFQSGRAMIATGFEAWAGVFSPDGEVWSALGKIKDERRIHRLAETGRVQAMAAADDFLREHETESAATKTKRWLDQPASAKQIELLNRFGYQAQADLIGNSGWTKYAACAHAEFQFNRHQIEAALGVRG